MRGIMYRKVFTWKSGEDNIKMDVKTINCEGQKLFKWFGTAFSDEHRY
jgi:hypothetical protein